MLQSPRQNENPQPHPAARNSVVCRISTCVPTKSNHAAPRIRVIESAVVYRAQSLHRLRFLRNNPASLPIVTYGISTSAEVIWHNAFNRVGNAPRLAAKRGPLGTRLNEVTSALVLTSAAVRDFARAQTQVRVAERSRRRDDSCGLRIKTHLGHCWSRGKNVIITGRNNRELMV